MPKHGVLLPMVNTDSCELTQEFPTKLLTGETPARV